MSQQRTLVVIPARMQSTRLPDKPLADIGGKPMIVHVWQRAMAAGVGRVVVATDSEAIAAAVGAAGGEAVMTRADHPSGSDRVFEAVSQVDPGRQFRVHPQSARRPADAGAAPAAATAWRLCSATAPDIATIAAEITQPEDRTNPNSVKVVGTPTGVPGRLRALYFTRATAPWGDGPLYHHFGMYAYRRSALERFVALAPRLWKSASSSNSSARWRTACAST